MRYSDNDPWASPSFNADRAGNANTRDVGSRCLDDGRSHHRWLMERNAHTARMPSPSPRTHNCRSPKQSDGYRQLPKPQIHRPLISARGLAPATQTPITKGLSSAQAPLAQCKSLSGISRSVVARSPPRSRVEVSKDDIEIVVGSSVTVPARVNLRALEINGRPQLARGPSPSPTRSPRDLQNIVNGELDIRPQLARGQARSPGSSVKFLQQTPNVDLDNAPMQYTFERRLGAITTERGGSVQLPPRRIVPLLHKERSFSTLSTNFIEDADDLRSPSECYHVKADASPQNSPKVSGRDSLVETEGFHSYSTSSHRASRAESLAIPAASCRRGNDAMMPHPATSSTCTLRSGSAPRNEQSHRLPLKLVVFDFDCTLSVWHVFHMLSGIRPTSAVPPPYARTEFGQLSRLAELDTKFGPGMFATLAFGGPLRVARLKSVLTSLRDGGVECIVVSRGMVGTNQKLLDQLGLLQFFGEVFGNIGCSMGTSDYDASIHSTGSDAKYLGNPEAEIGKVLKSELIASCIRKRGLTSDQVMFLDDDLEELASAQGLCKVVHVPGRSGVGEAEFKAILSRLPSAPSVASQTDAEVACVQNNRAEDDRKLSSEARRQMSEQKLRKQLVDFSQSVSEMQRRRSPQSARSPRVQTSCVAENVAPSSSDGVPDASKAGGLLANRYERLRRKISLLSESRKNLEWDVAGDTGFPRYREHTI